jgi:hypothetical protein
LNLFNAALVTPTYYVYFTSSTIITSAILFRGFKGSPTSIITVVMGFFVICAGVVLLQLSKSAKDVPDTAVFAGDLDQIRTIAEQEQPESEPKADAIRGAAAIVRRFSVTRQKMEADEAKRLHEEKMRDLEPVGENEQIEWDGLRRRRTTVGSRSMRSAPMTPTPFNPTTPSMHPPLGMSRFPTEAELQEDENRPNTALSSSFLGSFRNRARSTGLPHHEQNLQSPMHPVPLTEISIPGTKGNTAGNYFGRDDDGHRDFGMSGGLRNQKTEYEGGHGDDHHIHFSEAPLGAGERSESRGSIGPTPPPHSARRQFSFHNVFRKSQPPALEEPLPALPVSRKGLGSRQGSSQSNVVKGATEEERLGLVKGDTNVGRSPYGEDDDEEEESFGQYDDKRKPSLPLAGRVVAGGSPPRGRSDKDEEDAAYEQRSGQFQQTRKPYPGYDESKSTGSGSGGAFL